MNGSRFGRVGSASQHATSGVDGITTRTAATTPPTFSGASIRTAKRPPPAACIATGPGTLRTVRLLLAWPLSNVVLASCESAWHVRLLSCRSKLRWLARPRLGAGALVAARNEAPEVWPGLWLSMASGFCPVADSRTAQPWPTELPGGGQQSCPQFSWSVASPPFRRWLG